MTVPDCSTSTFTHLLQVSVLGTYVLSRAAAGDYGKKVSRLAASSGTGGMAGLHWARLSALLLMRMHAMRRRATTLSACPLATSPQRPCLTVGAAGVGRLLMVFGGGGGGGGVRGGGAPGGGCC